MSGQFFYKKPLQYCLASATGEMIDAEWNGTPGWSTGRRVIKLRMSYIEALNARTDSPTVSEQINYEWVKLTELEPCDDAARKLYAEALAAQRLLDEALLKPEHVGDKYLRAANALKARR